MAPPRPNLLLFPKEMFHWRFIAFCCSLPLLCQNCADHSPRVRSCPRRRAGSVPDSRKVGRGEASSGVGASRSFVAIQGLYDFSGQ